MANLEQLKFAKSHEWVADNGDGTFSIGLTDYAQKELGEFGIWSICLQLAMM